MDGWIDGWVGGWMDGWMDGCLYSNTCNFGTTCLHAQHITCTTAKQVVSNYLLSVPQLD